MEWIKRVNPRCRTLESWMRENNYTGKLKPDLLKNMEDGKSVAGNFSRIAKL